MLLLNYILKIWKSLKSLHWDFKDFLFIGVIIFMLIKGIGCHNTPVSHIAVPQLAPVTKTIDRAGKQQTTVPQVVYTPEEIKAVTKPLAKELKVDKVTSVTKDVITVNTQGLKSGVLIDTMTIIGTQKNHWFKPDEYSIKINHSDSLFKDSLASSYTFKENKTWLVIGPSIGSTIAYDGVKLKIRPSIGISATIPIISFKKKR